jgi:hypothetical protein
MGREKAPVGFFGFVEFELLKVLEGSRYIRHEVFLSINVGQVEGQIELGGEDW